MINPIKPKIVLILLLFVCSSCSQISTLFEDRPPAPYQRGNVLYVASGEDLSSIINSNHDYWIIFFSDKYCGSCKSYEPEFQHMANSYDNNKDLHFVRFDSFYDRAFARKYDIKSVPTTLFIKNGKTLKTFTGVVNREELSKVVNDILGKP